MSDRMKPIIILPPDAMSEADIKELRDNGLCVVVADDPAKVKFLDPIPSAAERTKIEDAAIELSRRVLASDFSNDSTSVWKSEICRTFVDVLVKGTRLDMNPSQSELEAEAYNYAKIDEARKIAREDARKEAAERKAAKEVAKNASKKNAKQ